MDYSELTAKELREICEEKGIKPSRAKVDMIEDLKAREAADELTRLSQEMEQGAADAPVPAPQAPPIPFIPEELQKPVERPVEPLVRSPGAEWVEGGIFLKEFDRGYALDTQEHESNLRQVLGAALAMGLSPYGPPYRFHERTNAFKWVYAINVH